MCAVDCAVCYIVIILNCIDFGGVNFSDMSPYFRGVTVEYE